jgi:hypothetical protein
VFEECSSLKSLFIPAGLRQMTGAAVVHCGIDTVTIESIELTRATDGSEFPARFCLIFGMILGVGIMAVKEM